VLKTSILIVLKFLGHTNSIFNYKLVQWWLNLKKSMYNRTKIEVIVLNLGTTFSNIIL